MPPPLSLRHRRCFRGSGAGGVRSLTPYAPPRPVHLPRSHSGWWLSKVHAYRLPPLLVCGRGWGGVIPKPEMPGELHLLRKSPMTRGPLMQEIAVQLCHLGWDRVRRACCVPGLPGILPRLDFLWNRIFTWPLPLRTPLSSSPLPPRARPP